MVISNKIKRVLHWFGGVFALLGILFICIRFQEYGDQLDFSRFSKQDWLIVFSLALAYGLFSLFLALAWRDVLKYLGGIISARLAIRIHGISQLAKYVPGNIFHLAGRQALGMAAGISGMRLAKSTMWELGLLATAGSLCACLALPLIWTTMPVMLSLACFVMIVAAACLVVGKLFDCSLSKALLSHVIFLIAAGIVFAAILDFSSSVDISLSTLPAICGAYIIAWLIGFVAPGAPAGVGIRELVLLFFLKTTIIEYDLLWAVMLGRATTIFGDLFYFFTAGLVGGEYGKYRQ